MGATWAALFQAFLPVLMLKEMVVKIFQAQPSQDSEIVEENGVADEQDAALNRSIRESSQSGEIEAHHGPTHNAEQKEESTLHPDTSGEAQEGHNTLNEMMVKIFQQPPQDSEMVEGNGVDDDQDAGFDCSIRESLESGEIEAHRGATNNTGQVDKSKLHRESEGEVREGRDTPKEMVVTMFQQPPQGSQMVEGYGVEDDQDAAFDCSIRESSEDGEIEAHRGPTHNAEQEDKSKLHPDTECEAQEEGHDTLKPIRESQVNDLRLAESQQPLSSTGLKRGTKRAITTESCERKKRKRCRNWTEHGETEKLIYLRLQRLRNKENVGRFGKNEANELVWEGISKQIPERTPEQCQNRWDTVVRSYKTIKSHLGGHKKQFDQITAKDFQKMQVAPYFRNAEWYKMFGEHREVWDLSHRGKGRRSPDMNGASIATGMPALSSAGSVNPDAFSTEAVTRTSPLNQSGPTMAACDFLLQ